MRRIHFVPVVTLMLSALILAYSQTSQSTSQPAQRATQAQPTESVKAKKVLVKELPKGLKGIVLENGVFKLQQGYKFVNQTSNTVAVALRAGGAVTGTFSCGCYVEGSGGSPSGNCKTAFDKEGRLCCRKDDKNPCNATCHLEVKVDKSKLSLAIF